MARERPFSANVSMATERRSKTSWPMGGSDRKGERERESGIDTIKGREHLGREGNGFSGQRAQSLSPDCDYGGW